MKRLLFILIFFVSVSTLQLFAQDVVGQPTGNYYKDTLTTTIDTIDVLFNDYLPKDTYTLTAYTTTGTDTVLVYTQSLDMTTWVYKTEFVITTTPVEYGIDDPQPNKIRLITADVSASCVFILAGKVGVIYDYGDADLSATADNQTTLIANQTNGTQKTQVVYTASTSIASFDSAATATDTTDLGSVKEVLGFFASSTFDSSAVTMDINLSGTALYSVWSETAQFSVNLDSSGLVYFDSPIIARKVKLNFTAQNSAASITLIYK
jgi:hypothetical protein